MSKSSEWSYTAGQRPYRVRVYERSDSANIYCAIWDPKAEKEKRRSLRKVLDDPTDRDQAISWADKKAGELREQAPEQDPAEAAAREPTAGRVLSLYREHRSPDKSKRVQAADERQAEMWKRVLGADFKLPNLSRREWDQFMRQRRSGAIDARGNPVPEGERTEVSLRTLERDGRFLRAVCQWATEFSDSSGRPVLTSDPTAGQPVSPKKLHKRYGWPQHNPKRPVASHDRVDAIREHYHKPTMRVERGGKREKMESYLPEIFEIVVGTGRRISAVCSLRMENLESEATPKAPDGAIVWPADTDKEGKPWRCPISGPVREAVEAAKQKRRKMLGRVGPGPLFPAPGNPERAVRYEEASKWLREAEGLAELEPQDGTLWHAYRRLWATARKDLPDVDVARAGGWSSLEAFKAAYQRPDDETMLTVVQHDAEVREVR